MPAGVFTPLVEPAKPEMSRSRVLKNYAGGDVTPLVGPPKPKGQGIGSKRAMPTEVFIPLVAGLPSRKVQEVGSRLKSVSALLVWGLGLRLTIPAVKSTCLRKQQRRKSCPHVPPGTMGGK